MISEYIVDSSGVSRKRNFTLMMRFAAAITLVALLALPGWTENPERQLKSELKGKTVLIRGFFQDDKLVYNAQGEVMGTPKPGSWTVAQMQVKGITVRQDRFEVRGPRLIAFMDPDKHKFTTIKPSHKQSIKVTIHASPSALNQQQLDALIQKVFVTDRNPNIGVFPPYWHEFLSGNVMRAKDNDGKLIFKFKNHEQPDVGGGSEDRPVYTDSAGNPVFRVSKTIEGPRIVYQIDPDFTESARDEKFTGTTIVSVEVDKTGAIHDIQIVQPIGYGLDDHAVRAVEQWRFAPAMRNGEPIAVLVNVEVSFRLY